MDLTELRGKYIEAVAGAADEATPDCEGTDEVFEILRASNFLAAHLDKVRDTPDMVGPNVRANVDGWPHTILRQRSSPPPYPRGA